MAETVDRGKADAECDGAQCGALPVEVVACGLRVRQIFLAAAVPMVVAAVAAVILVRLCYVRLGTMRLSDENRNGASSDDNSSASCSGVVSRMSGGL